MDPELDLTEKLCLAFAEVARQIKATNADIGDLPSLVGAAAGSPDLVTAINALDAAIAASTVIDDAVVSLTTTFSSQEIVDRLVGLETSLLGGIPPVTLDTIAELAAAIQAGDLEAMGFVSFNTDQTGLVTSTQQAQARDNINVFSRDEIGDVTKDFCAVFDAALIGPAVTVGATFTTAAADVVVNLTFDEAINPATLAPADVELVDTVNSTTRVDGVVAIAGDNLSATVTFATPNVASDYSARVVNDAVSDVDGNPSGPTGSFEFTLPA